MRLISSGPEETFRYGFKLGCLLEKGDIVCLYGELGSGKTTFTKGIASALGVPERDITSASFTIIAEYEGKLPFYHIDLYRIEDVSQLDFLGLEEYLGKGGVSVIEWADRLEKIDGSISATFCMLGEKQREITIEGVNEKDWDNMQSR